MSILYSSARCSVAALNNSNDGVLTAVSTLQVSLVGCFYLVSEPLSSTLQHVTYAIDTVLSTTAMQLLSSCVVQSEFMYKANEPSKHMQHQVESRPLLSMQMTAVFVSLHRLTGACSRPQQLQQADLCQARC